MDTGMTEQLSENPITRLLAQANLHAQNEQRSTPNEGAGQLTPQEMLLMQMLKVSNGDSKSKVDEESQADSLENELELEKQEEEISPAKGDEPAKVRYEVKFLLSLEFSPLVLPPSFWESELPPPEFFRLNKGPRGSFGTGTGAPTDGRRERRKSSNARRGSNLKKDKPFALVDDMKKEITGTGTAREDRRTQRARQRENKRRGTSQKMDNSAIEEGDEFADTPEWMKEQDSVTGNSILDFEMWRLKMRIETAKRNGEEVNADDMKELDKLKSQLVTNKHKSNDQSEQWRGDSDDGETVKDSAENVGEATVQQQQQEQQQFLEHQHSEEKVHRSVDDQFDITLPTNSNTRTSGSHFSSFFGPEKSSPPVIDSKQRSSRLMSIISDETQSPVTSSTPPLPSQGPITSPPIMQSNNYSPQPMIMPQASGPIDRNQLFLQSLMAKSATPPPQHGQHIQQHQLPPMHQLPPKGIDPRMAQGLQPNTQFFPQHMQMQYPSNGVPVTSQQYQQQYKQQNQPGSHQLNQPQQQQQLLQLQPQQQLQQQQLQQQQLHQQQLQQQRHHQQQQQQQQQESQHREFQQAQQPRHLRQSPQTQLQQQQQRQQQQQQQPQHQSPLHGQNLPYGNNSGNMPGMAPNHPLMMLLNKNKRKSSQDAPPASVPASPRAQASTPPVQENIRMQQPNGQNFPAYPPHMNMNMNMNMNGVNGINGINGMNGMNGMNGANNMSGMHGMHGMNTMGGMNGMNGVNGMNMMNMNGVNAINMNLPNGRSLPTSRPHTPY
ncbi:hypothetical protein PMKS-003097 [Pichia membranifaciens]|uniref:Uncharacterized protein n=1 Tax=Pichia membranifaciens TaxID=4926 RepID=A0A1Q2YJ68_9ASCO|nr:hypothetical protein PMKS-003097 [Pichia membranifaciens]